MLFDLSKFSIFEKTVRKVNLQAFCHRFLKTIFNEIIKTDLANNFIYFEKLKEIFINFFDNY